MCCSDETWHESEAGDHPVLFPPTLLSVCSFIYPKKYSSLKRRIFYVENTLFNLRMGTLEDSKRADKPCR